MNLPFIAGGRDRMTDMNTLWDDIEEALDRRAPALATVAVAALRTVAVVLIVGASALVAVVGYGVLVRWATWTPLMWGILVIGLLPVVGSALACAWASARLARWRAAEIAWRQADDADDDVAGATVRQGV